MPSENNPPSLWDIQHIIERNYTDSKEDILDLKAQLSRQAEVNEMRFNQYLLKAVYEAEKKASDEKIEALQKEIISARVRAITAIYTGLASAAAAILAGIILAVVLGGH